MRALACTPAVAEAAASYRDSTRLLRSIAADARNGLRRAPRPYFLVVDDDEASLRVTAFALEAIGTVVAMTSAVAALSLLSVVPPGTFNLVLADVVMPDMDGREFRASAAAVTDVRIVLFTGVDAEADEDVIRKPVTPAEIRARVGSLLLPSS